MTSSLTLYNSLTRRKESLQTGQPDRVTMYVCGPTVYDFAHIGNARSAIVFDVLARLLREQYANVVYARNFTDMDDKINASAAAQGVPIGSVTARYIDAYHDDMRALGVSLPDLEPRVTEHIPAIIDLIQRLIENENAYFEQGHVLFHVPSYAAYGQLSGRRPENIVAGARVEVAPYKRDPLDFVLWKPSPPELPGWESPWGRGRPGWHIECSAMIGQHLGTTIDIHGGGQDLIFPHHENEIAQGTCANGKLYCRTWVHNSFVTADGQKMSKSLGNVLLVRDLIQQAPGEAIRLALLSAHYRHPLDWTAQRLATARQTLLRFYRSLKTVEDVEALPEARPDQEFVAALNNDLNVPGALARLHVLLGDQESAGTDSTRAAAKARLLASGRLLGLLQTNPSTAVEVLTGVVDGISPLTTANLARIDDLVTERERARLHRDFARADALRDELSAAGVLVHDTRDASNWRFADGTAT